MVAELLRSNDVELIIVSDWSGGAYSSYAQAIANIRVVAVQLAHLLNNLMVFFSLHVCL